jgi:signal transduction histidine kinase
MGIEAAYLERIFAPFERLRNKRIPGCGLGLATAREIVERHGGRIWSESTPGAGSAFFFTLPAA